MSSIFLKMYLMFYTDKSSTLVLASCELASLFHKTTELFCWKYEIAERNPFETKQD